MRRALLRIVAPPRPLVAPRTSTVVRQNSTSSMQERLRRRLWGDNTPSTSTPATPDADKNNYIPALDGRALPIAGLAVPLGVWEVDRYAPSTTITDTEALTRAVHRATVETLVVLSTVGQEADGAFLFGTPTDGERDVTDGVEIMVGGDKSVTLRFVATTREGVLESLEPVAEWVYESGKETREVEDETALAVAPAPAAAAEEGEVEAETQPPAAPAPPTPYYLTSTTWLTTPLPNPTVTFLLTKRILQLTGRRVPDATLTFAYTVNDLLTALLTKPAPAKLHEVLLSSDLGLGEMPNVKVYTSRLRPMDKERLVGRARPIEKVVDHKYEGIDREKKGWRGHVTFDG